MPKSTEIPEFQPRPKGGLRDMKNIQKVNEQFGIEPKKA
jgi:hypothetical protein